MKLIRNILFSFQLTAVLLITFAGSMAVATFIENDYGTSAALDIVYNATWFEALLIIGIVNLTGNIITRRLYRKEKLSVFTFHLAFVVILIGAAITRYTGFTGLMNIREGDSSNTIMSDQNYICVTDTSIAIKKYYPVLFSQRGKNNFHKKVNLKNLSAQLELKNYYPKANKTIVPADQGTPAIELVRAGQQGRETFILKQGQTQRIGPDIWHFGTDSLYTNTDVIVFTQGQTLKIKSKKPYVKQQMMNESSDTLAAMQSHYFFQRQLYNFGINKIVLSKFFPTAKLAAQEVSPNTEGVFYEALDLEVSLNNKKQMITLFGLKNQAGEMAQLDNLQLSYGAKPLKIPFRIELVDFIIKRYPGSNSPSWFESKIILHDPENRVTDEQRIFMNNVLKYGGFRFYQSSYDTDEKGTVLSVNKDLAGTLVTYLGYVLLAAGMFWSVFNPKSRFAFLMRNLKQIKSQKAGLLLVILFGMGTVLQASDGIQEHTPIINAEHARKFGELLVQDNGGRVKPLNTLNSEVLRKISRKNSIDGLTPDQVMLSMLINPAYWREQPLIKVSHPQIKEMVSTNAKRLSFNQLVSGRGYILSDIVNEAFRKKAAMRTKLDNDVIKVDERLNILYLSLTGELLRVFPIPGHPNDKWVNHTEIKNIVGPDTVFTKKVFGYYLQTLHEAVNTGDYGMADTLLAGIKAYQQKYGDEIIPKESKINVEIWYNKADPFNKLSNYYGLFGFALLIIQFVGLFYVKLNLRRVINIFSYALMLLFIMHTVGLGIRWYIGGHAPWSNGYESMIYISWATVLAGIIFSRQSSIALSATSILAFITLHVAHLSWMDPEITNLVPVLKSYWLVIHVAIITASYGFLGLGAILAFLNLILMFLQSPKNKKYFDLTISELSAVIELTLTIGLYMLTIGTFLGGVWANESWGRYWAWDPKETWALITVIIYAFVAHMRMIPGLRGVFAFNFMSLISFASVLMTYFGVNYYLSGLHSYAKGDPVPVPDFVYYTLITITVVSVLAYYNHIKIKNK